jgi:thiol-disulfide isomerase/thioredoxin
MMAPIFKQVAKEYVDRAVFVKVDTNAQYELSSKYQIRSLPTFMVMIGGSKWQEQKGGIGEAGLKQLTEQAIRQAELENVKLELEDLVAFYQEVDPNKPESDVKIVYSKCTDLKTKKTKYCQGAAAQNLVRKLKKKYKKTPKMSKLFEPVADKSEEDSASGSNERKPSSSNPSSTTASSNKKKTGQAGKPNLHLATKEELQEELERRLDEERDQEVENEDIDEEDALDETHKHSTWTPGPFPERVVIIGGGPAGMASALYAARAGLAPLVIAPSMGGQLQGKGK